MNRLFVLGILVVALSGCATTMTPDQKWDQEYKQAIDLENWENCQVLLKYHRILWTSGHSHRRNVRHRPHEIEADLRDAECRLRLGDYWIRE